MNIVGHVQDIEPKKPEPRLELYFETSELHKLGNGRDEKQPIVFDINGTFVPGRALKTATGSSGSSCCGVSPTGCRLAGRLST